ncbi:MAG: tyrosine-protein phosphatase [Bacilli bacterium]|nr:tyrosine-protein phosphatase [Bacilli bacterium]
MKRKTLLISLLSLAMLAACAAPQPSKSEPAKDSEPTSSVKEESTATSETKTSETKTSETKTSETKTSETKTSSTTSETPVEAGVFTNVTTFTSPINNKTADQKAFIEYSGDYTKISSSTFQNTFHTTPNGHQSDPTAVPFSFKHSVPSGKILSKYVLEFATDSEFTKDVLTYESKNKSFDIYNLYIGTHYFYRLKAVYTAGDPDISDTYELDTADAGIRNLRVDGMTNVRDLGGKTTESGAKIKQGLLYRTGAPNDSQSQCAITDAGKKTMLNEMGVKTEIELREMGFNCPSTSPVGSSVKIYHNAMEYQGGKNLIFRNIAPMLRCFDILGDANNYPIFFHCRIGTDRTGFMALLINGVLGLPMKQIYQDYLFSNFGRIGKTSTCDQVNDDSTAGYIAQINTYPGESFQQKCYNFLVTAGVPHEKLDTMINLLTEGTPAKTQLDQIGLLKGEDFTLSGTSMINANKTISKSTIRNPGYNYFKLSSTSQTATYKFNVDKAFSGNLYSTFLAKNTSLNINSAMSITLDGAALTLDTTSFATSSIGFDNNTEYWTTWKLGSINVGGAGEHTLVIKPKTSTALSFLDLAMFSNDGPIQVTKVA